MDRVRAVRFGIKSLQHLETFIGKSRQEVADDPMSASVIGIRGAKVKFSAMERIEREETDWKDRRPKEEFWMNLVDIVDTLSGRPKACRTPLPGSPAIPGNVPQDHTPMPGGSPVLDGTHTPADADPAMRRSSRDVLQELRLSASSLAPNGTAR
jgi:hypothetical protein